MTFPRIVAAVFALLCCAGHAPAQQTESLRQALGEVPDFSLTERSGKTVRRADLLGKVWVAAFFFTECAGGCPKISSGLQHLQQQLAGVKDVVLVSFSVNPQSDTPQRLREYARDHGADAERWLFLTGDEKAMYTLIRDGFKQGVSKNEQSKPGFEVDHTFRMLVVDSRGRIRGYIGDGREREEIARLEERVRDLVRARDLPQILPTVNAVLNGTCALLLLAGYVAIRRRQITLHKVCMLSALLVSAIFLACYLYYHFVILDGKPTRFSGEGWVRPVYFGVLLSHTVLAAAVAPLAIITAVLGLRNRLQGHMRLARWTLPLWLYVSVTGVVVYLMLYHLYPPV
jgi:protein SCO1/2/putative membrane protein